MEVNSVLEVLKSLHFTNNNWMLIIPCFIIVLDVLSGILNAWVKGEIKSCRLREGLGKKVGELMLLIIAVVLSKGFGLTNVVTSVISVYISFMELISIMENLDKLGVPIPKFIERALVQTSDRIQNGVPGTDNTETSVDTAD